MRQTERFGLVHNENSFMTIYFVKVTRAIYSLSQPPTSLPLEVLVNQASKEIVAAEKLRVLESKKEIGKGQADRRPVERFKRDVRLPI
jgi:hypothetical protein